MGFEDSELVPLYNDVQVGVVLREYHGLARDLWGITKIKTAGGTEHAVVVRDMLHRPDYRIYFAAAKTSMLGLQEMEAAFVDPAFPLTLGRSDELILVRTLSERKLQAASADDYYRYTVLPFDYRKRKHILEQLTASSRPTLELPQVFRLPISFAYDATRKRVVQQYGVFTHVLSTAVKLENNVGWRDEHERFFLY